MKTKIFALFLGMLCLLTNALAQSETLTGFNGRIKFTSFANNGLYVRGTLDDFLDQTNQYVASDIDSADVVWDNQGRRYLVHDVISSNITQAVVDLSRIGGGSHIPTGVGFVSRETSNGLALVPPVNSTGISTQLASRVGVHNAKILEGLKTIYTGSDSIKVMLVLVKMAADGSQNFGLGYLPDFPDENYDYLSYGLFVNPLNYGEVSLLNKGGTLRLYDGQIDLEAHSTNNSNGKISIQQGRIRLLGIKGDGSYSETMIDSLGIFISSGSFGNYRLIPDPNNAIPSGKPSTIASAISSLTHIGGIPSFVRSQHGVSTASTDGSGDLTITVPTMPDATYYTNITVEGTTSYTVSVHTKTTTTFKVRFFNPTTGAAVTATSVSCSYKIEDY